MEYSIIAEKDKQKRMKMARQIIDTSVYCRGVDESFRLYSYLEAGLRATILQYLDKKITEDNFIKYLESENLKNTSFLQHSACVTMLISVKLHKDIQEYLGLSKNIDIRGKRTISYCANYNFNNNEEGELV